MENNSLYHYGVKGMKWGVRRYQSKSGGSKTSEKKKSRKRRVAELLAHSLTDPYYLERINKGKAYLPQKRDEIEKPKRPKGNIVN